MRFRRWLIAGGLVTALAACSGDQDPVPGVEDGDLIEPNGEDEGERGDGAEVEPASTREEPRDRIIKKKLDTFSDEVLGLQAGDIVLVRMAKTGGIMKASLVSVRPRVLTVTAQDNSITSRFKPEEVAEVKLLYRDDPDEVTFSSDAPLNDEETWLDRYADRSVLGHDPAELWKNRFARNVALTVKRSFKISALAFLKRRGRSSFFVREETKEIIRQHDQLKLVGLSNGLGRNPQQGGDEELGEVYLYLVRHEQKVRLVCSLRRIGAKYFDTAAVKRFLRSELVVLAVRRPGSSKHLKIVRVPGATARKYRRALESTPGRAELLRLRAQRSVDLEKAEQAVRAIYQMVDLEEEHLEYAILVELRVPSADKGLRLVPYSKELGLD